MSEPVTLDASILLYIYVAIMRGEEQISLSWTGGTSQRRLLVGCSPKLFQAWEQWRSSPFEPDDARLQAAYEHAENAMLSFATMFRGEIDARNKNRNK